MNLLLVVLEDCTAQALGCYGNPLVRTPAIDAFARTALRFDRAYCQSTVCNPSRASFLTGLRPTATRVYYNGDALSASLPGGALSLPQLARSQGVFSAVVGKLFHSAAAAGPYLALFDRLELGPLPPGYGGISSGYQRPAGAPEPPKPRFRFSADPELERELVRREDAWLRRSPPLPEGSRQRRQAQESFRLLESELVGDSGLADEQEQDGQVARLAARLLHELSREGRRFLLGVGFTRPHTPLRCPRRYVDLYDPEAMPLPPAPREADRGIPEVARRWGQNYDLFNQLEPTPPRVRRAIAAYYACLSFVDAQFGLVLEALEAAGLAETTLVIFTADHGFHLGEHGCWSKATLFEQSTRVPLLVRVPGAAAGGQTSDQIVELVDLVPTLADLWGIRAEGWQGTSFRPLLRDSARPWKRVAATVCALERVLGRSLRTGRYRYTEWQGHRRDGSRVFEVELYDLERDPWEQVNVAADSGHRQVRTQLSDLLARTGSWSPRFVGKDAGGA